MRTIKDIISELSAEPTETLPVDRIMSAIAAHDCWSRAVMRGEPESTCAALHAEYQRLAVAAGL
jgi:hypothetical protein